jgi:pimeloyl-ACP methyl ester carboxylesterase
MKWLLHSLSFNSYGMIDMYEHEYINVNKICLHIVTAGNPPGRPVVLLHGFPEFWYGWRRQIPALAAAGFWVIVPDQRGYNLSAKPPRVDSYCMQALTGDVFSLLDHFGLERVSLVGHDWGAMVAWDLAIHYPRRIERLGILNVPHPRVLWDFLLHSPRQMFKSWYAGFFQLPALPEFLLRLNHFAAMARLLISSGKSGTFASNEIEAYKTAWAQPRALTSMLNWYRAALRGWATLKEDWRVHTPTLILWGKQDVALSAAMAPRSLGWCDRGRLIIFDNASHWVQLDEADAVNRSLLEFFQEG